MVMVPATIPNVSFSTLATGARQFVVQEALEMMLCFCRVVGVVVHAEHKCGVRSVAGAEMMTFFTEPRMCFLASAPLVKRPVDSTTISAPTEAQSISRRVLGLENLEALAVHGDGIFGAGSRGGADCRGWSRT